MFTLRSVLWAIAVFATSTAISRAAPQGPESTTEEFMAKLSYQQGKVDLQGGLATLKLSPDFRYLDSEQSRRVLVEAWGNPPELAEGVLGMIFPTVDDDGWGVVITYEEGGYVSDEGAEKTNYDKRLTAMQTAAREASKERQQAGYKPVELVGWVELPHYDRLAHKLYWAKELKFGDSASHTLNYEIRVLGRRGVLVLTAVAAMDRLSAVKSALTKVLARVEFNEGHRYADYVPGKDQVTEYGIAALVAGSVFRNQVRDDQGLAKAEFNEGHRYTDYVPGKDQSR